MKLYDAHAHLGNETEWNERLQNNITSLICAVSPPEAAALKKMTDKLTSPSPILPTYGLHPWQAKRFKVSEMAPFFAECSVMGEIGMDSVWCSTALDIQEAVFREQLSLACDLKKPVILHTKGQEKQIAEIIRHYHNTYLVHWYSSPYDLERFLALDCYYTVGPDLWWNQTTQWVTAQVPLDRLLIETDGMEAVTWAYEEALKVSSNKNLLSGPIPHTVSESLSLTLKTAAQIQQLPEETLQKQIEENFLRFTLKKH